MAILITSAGTYTVDPNETYVIDPGVEGDVKFRADPADPQPVDFTVALNGSPADPGKSVGIKIEGMGLSPTITVADEYDGPKTTFDLTDAEDATLDVGSDVVLGGITGAKTGADDYTFGDDVLVKDGVDTEGGPDSITAGENFTTESSKAVELGGSRALDMDGFVAGDGFSAKGVTGGDGDQAIRIGDDAAFETIETDEIVFAEGLPSESLHPGMVGLGGMAEDARREILALFPALAQDVAAYGPSCRPSLKAYEASGAGLGRDLAA